MYSVLHGQRILAALYRIGRQSALADPGRAYGGQPFGGHAVSSVVLCSAERADGVAARSLRAAVAAKTAGKATGHAECGRLNPTNTPPTGVAPMPWGNNTGRYFDGNPCQPGEPVVQYSCIDGSVSHFCILSLPPAIPHRRGLCYVCGYSVRKISTKPLVCQPQQSVVQCLCSHPQRYTIQLRPTEPPVRSPPTKGFLYTQGVLTSQSARIDKTQYSDKIKNGHLLMTWSQKDTVL